MKNENLNIKNPINLLDQVKNKISLGYTHDNFVDISYLIKDLSQFLDLSEILCLESFWRDSYTDSINEKALNRKINELKNKLMNDGE